MSTPSISFAPTPAVLSKQWDAGQDPTFAFARLQCDICLVQCESIVRLLWTDILYSRAVVGWTTVDSSGTPLLDIHVFRHEFATIFRYSHSARVHPLELRVFEPLDIHAVRYEPDSGTVFLAKDPMVQLKRIMDATAMFNRTSGRLVPQR